MTTAGDELEPGRHAGQVAEEHEDLVEHVLGPVRADQVGMAGVVRAEHVVVGEQVVEAELLHGLRELAHAAGVGADLGLREDGSELHWRSTREPPTMASRPSAKRTQALPLPS